MPDGLIRVGTVWLRLPTKIKWPVNLLFCGRFASVLQFFNIIDVYMDIDKAVSRRNIFFLNESWWLIPSSSGTRPKGPWRLSNRVNPTQASWFEAAMVSRFTGEEASAILSCDISCWLEVWAKPESLASLLTPHTVKSQKSEIFTFGKTVEIRLFDQMILKSFTYLINFIVNMFSKLFAQMQNKIEKYIFKKKYHSANINTHFD